MEVAEGDVGIGGRPASEVRRMPGARSLFGEVGGDRAFALLLPPTPPRNWILDLTSRSPGRVGDLGPSPASGDGAKTCGPLGLFASVLFWGSESGEGRSADIEGRAETDLEALGGLADGEGAAIAEVDLDKGPVEDGRIGAATGGPARADEERVMFGLEGAGPDISS
jgi:hypothetical protein